MDFPAYYRNNVTYTEHDDRRLDKIVDVVEELAPRVVLDLGCGTGWLVRRLRTRLRSTVVGVDILDGVVADGWSYVSADVTHGLPFGTASVGCVIAGEIIEHVPDPDGMLLEIRRVLVPGGSLVVSTPNIVSWANRILVPLGVQPLGTETSSVVALGRRWRLLGQGNRVQGHLKVFSHLALAEILERYGFSVTARYGMPAEFPFPASAVDRFFTRFVPLASDLLFVARCRAPPGAARTTPALRPAGAAVGPRPLTIRRPRPARSRPAAG